MNPPQPPPSRARHPTLHPLLSDCPPDRIEALLRAEHHDPHAILGVHPLPGGGLGIRAMHPDAVGVDLRGDVGSTAMERVDPRGLFAARVTGATMPWTYRLRFRFPDGSSQETEDAYRFTPTLGDLDCHLFNEGKHYDIHRKLGAHLLTHQNIAGVSFAVWAPNARRVSVVGDFCRWDGRRFPMRMLGVSGLWELFIPGVGPGEKYKFEIKTASGALRIKTDPYAFRMEPSPASAAVVHDLSAYRWGDADWMRHRKDRDHRHAPMAIYEVHLGSWQRVPEEGHRRLSYRESAPRLIAHAKAYGFTHVELLPIAEHPFDGSWGYQVTGYFAPTHRHGDPDDFRWFVDQLHRAGLGVIIDWVPAHFPKDDFALRRFDGTALYEHEDPRLGEHRDWGTLIFNYGRHEVRNFLIANALFWLEEYHVDGLRVDAVASMLYLDYSRREGEWIPNVHGGRENLDAVAFLRELNEAVRGRVPGAFTIAEESTAWPAVSRPAESGGLGFGFKWNMGWMHDTLSYFRTDPLFRRYHHDRITFGLLYAWSEHFILPFSHDEVVHGKGSLLGRMPGNYWQKMANLRLLFAYLYTHPGKKLLFMGGEFGQDAEWRHDRSLEWHQAAEPDPLRQGLQRCLQALGRLYGRTPALWQLDDEPRGFQWISCDDADQSVFSFVRWSHHGQGVVVVLNMTPVVRHGYRIGVPGAGTYREIFNSDSSAFGGSNVGNGGAIATQPISSHGFGQSLEMILPPLGALLLLLE